MLEEAWAREAVRLHRRYQDEIVASCDLCPWAVRATQDGKIRERVSLQTDPTDMAPALSAIDEWQADPEAEVTFLIYPRLDVGRHAFHDFAARLRDADGPRHPLGAIPFVLAAFHPDAEPDTADPERLIPFLRRSPDPTLQLLRASVLDSIRSGAAQGTQFLDRASLEAMVSGTSQPPLRERIARANLETARRVGIDTLRARLDDIRRDRETTYRRLLQS